jgi:O-antigen/teichoic acid export membrane protein
VLVIGTALNGLMHVPYFAQLAYGQTRLGVIVNSIAVAVIVPALLYFVPRHGMMAAASIWVAINAGYVLLGMPAVHARILRGELGRWYLQDVAAPLLAGLAATVLVRLAFDLLPSPGRFALLPYLLVAAGAIFAASALATPLGRERFLRLVRDRVPT